MQSQRYKKPSKVNIVSIVLILGLLAGAYYVIQWGPHYYRKWKAQGVISELTNKLYSKRFVGGDAESQLFADLKREAETRLAELGIREANLQVTMSKTQHEANVSATYMQTIKHWFVDKTTVLTFTLTERAERSE